MSLLRALLASLVLASPVFAQTAVPAFELERLTLNPSASGGLLVGGADLLPQRRYRVSLTGHYEHDPLVYLGTSSERLGTIVGGRVSAHLAAAYSVIPRLEFGLQVPLVAWQGGAKGLEGAGVVPVDSFALGTPWLQARVGILSQADGQAIDLVAGWLFGLPVGSSTALTRDNGFSVIPRLGVGRTFRSKVRIGGELGGWLRPAQTLSPDSAASTGNLGSAIDVGLGATTLSEGVRFEASVRVAVPLNRQSTATELMFGVRLPAGPWEFYALAGPGFGRAPGTPLFRALLGVAFNGDLTRPVAPPLPVVEPPPPPVAPLTAPPVVVFVPEPVKPPPAQRCVAGRPHVAAECPELDLDGDGVKNSADRCPEVQGSIATGGCPDTDGDTVVDSEDACPAVAGLVEFKGCPDTDKDGITDADDKCPNVAGLAAFQGCPDRDADGVADADDLCPAQPGLAQFKGCPDTDKDGVPDNEDNCRIEPGPKENQGCPLAKQQLVVITRDKLVIKDRVYFDTAKSTIQKRSFGMLDQVATILVEHPDVKHVRVEGHTDSVGKADYNRKLSQSRAESVVGYLVKKGVEARRLDAKGFGPDKPIASNDAPAGREQNRRVEFVISGEEKLETKTLEVP